MGVFVIVPSLSTSMVRSWSAVAPLTPLIRAKICPSFAAFSATQAAFGLSIVNEWYSQESINVGIARKLQVTVTISP